MYTKARVVIPFILLSCLSLIEAQENQKLINSEFADFLFNSELYELAAEEYERLLYYTPENIAALTKLVKCYTLTGNEHLIEQRFKLSETTNRELSLSYFDLLFSLKKSEKFKEFYLKQKGQLTVQHNQEMRLRSAILNNEWDTAQKEIGQSKLSSYAAIKEKIEQSNFKNPTLAAGLSALLPGSGRIYAKDAKDGLVSLLFVGSFGYQSYRRFDQKGIKDAGAWIFGGLALGFYVSNIYGSYQSAKYYNNKQNEKIYNFSLPLLLSESN